MSNIRNFLDKQTDDRYRSLKVEHYEDSDSKYWSDIKITNPSNDNNVWVEAKLNKFANLGSASFKYIDGEWSCTTLDDDDPLLGMYIDAISSNSVKFIEFCKEYLGKDDIRLPKDLTKDLVEAWKKTGSIEDTDNNTQFITNKIPMEQFGFKIAEFYKFSKNEPVYYMQCGDDLYIIDPNYNPLGLKCSNGDELKPLSEAYRIGRIQFRLKGQEKVNGTATREYYSIYADVKILSDKENLDKEYSCSFNSEDKWPVIQSDEIEISESESDDIAIEHFKNTKSTNKDNPDTKKTYSSIGELLTVVDTVDGRFILVNNEGMALRRDDNKDTLMFDDISDARRWARERDYDIELCNDEHKDFNTIKEKQQFHLKDKQDTYKPEENNYRFKNKNEKYSGDDYINSVDILSRIDPNLSSKFGPKNWFKGPGCMNSKNSEIFMKIDDGKDTVMPVVGLKNSMKYGKLTYLTTGNGDGMNVVDFSSELMNMTTPLGGMRRHILVYMNSEDNSVYVCNGIEQDGDDVILDMEWGDPIEYSKELEESESNEH